MHPNPSLVNGTVDDAIAALARRQVALAHGAPPIEKSIMEKTAVLQGLGKWWSGLDDITKKTIIGAGAGAGLGGASSLMKDKEDRNTGSSLFTGALAGGAIGAGLGTAQRFSNGSSNSGKGSSLSSGHFYHPDTGKKMQWSKDLDPELLKRVSEAQRGSKGGDIIDKGLETTGGAIAAVGKNYPVTAGTAGLLVAKNIASEPTGNSRLARFGRKLGMGGWGINKLHSESASHLQSGVEAIMSGKDTPAYLNKRQMDALRKLQAAAANNPKLYAEIASHAKSPQGWRGVLGSKTKSPILDRGTINNIIGHGVDITTPEAAKKLGITPSVRKAFLHRITRGKLGQPHVNMAGRGGLTRTALKYGLGLGGLGLGEHFIHSQLAQRRSAQELDELFNRYAKPVE